MNARLFSWSGRIVWIVSLTLFGACLDKFTIDLPPAEFQMVVDGMISDNPGPYTVKLSKTFNLDADSAIIKHIKEAKIKLFDDEGNDEDFTEESPGVYVTGGVIQGQVGHSYHIEIETSDGKQFRSDPDMITPGGSVEKIEPVFEARITHKYYGDFPADVFNIFIDAQGGPAAQNYVRWRYTGIYKVAALPQFHAIFSEGSAYIDPLICSGYVVEPSLGGGKLVKVGECTCCTCWVTEYETLPQISDGQFVANNEFKHVKVGEVPINNISFYDKYLVIVEQMSLSKSTYSYYSLIKTQHDGSTSVFQPPYNQIKGNINSVNSTEIPLGLFFAASLKTSHLFIDRKSVPYILTRIDPVYDACDTYYNHSTLIQPPLWE